MDSEFSFSRASCHTNVKEFSRLKFLNLDGGRINGFKSFSRELTLCEKLIASSRIWTRFTVSISWNMLRSFLWTFSRFWVRHSLYFIWRYERLSIFCPTDRLSVNRRNAGSDLILFRYSLQHKLFFFIINIFILLVDKIYPRLSSVEPGRNQSTSVSFFSFFFFLFILTYIYIYIYIICQVAKYSCL